MLLRPLNGYNMKTKLTDDRYTYRVIWSEEDCEHVGLCAEFPSLSWMARTPEACPARYPASCGGGRGGPQGQP